MFEVIYELATLKIGSDLVLVDGKWIYNKSKINICPLAQLNVDSVLLGKEKIKVINSDKNTLKLFLDFLDQHGHLTLCPRVLEALCEIFSYSFSLLEFGENLIVASDIFNTAVLTTILIAANCKIYFVNKQIHVYSHLQH